MFHPRDTYGHIPNTSRLLQGTIGKMHMPTNKLLAWIEPRTGGEYMAAFVSFLTASRRAPATRRCASADEARQWVEHEAAAFGVPVEWTDQSPQRVR
ncbi:MAG TPA: hypothetical protein VK822_26645 [Acetobacteraceae bacterium]|nr:hypothetical protein [Acetobacteraceae bacterium]